MDLGLQGKTAIITGGASGLGAETARYLVREGVRVLIADVHDEAIVNMAAELRDLGGEAEGVRVDVCEFSDCERMANYALDTFGTIDIVVACAGVGGGNKYFLETRPEEWGRVLDVNVRGLLNTNRATAQFIVNGGRGGSIINIASEAGKVGERKIAVYSASKGAVISFSKAFALEMGRYKVRVNAVCPGVTRTPMTQRFGGPGDEIYVAASKLYPLGRLGEPDDIAAMITFLASDQATWITGQAISVNGGFGRS